ncbi:hypothetical protein [Epibacterium ulvae]|uniref:Uncharacterized protein n=1 Tax=Epibacterium ulvae TaxID=1156985 RepID=A0A1G5QSX2_9RHOB|nr:hypothetical protein [Epibacterium ulvae]SCZ64668.1 hypothetical protein SAMN04488118_105289 [Epibacterium ulvae]
MVFFGILCGMVFGGITALTGVISFDFSIWVALASYSVVGSTAAVITTVTLYAWSSSDDDWSDYDDNSRKDDSLELFGSHEIDDQKVGSSIAA